MKQSYRHHRIWPRAASLLAIGMLSLFGCVSGTTVAARSDAARSNAPETQVVPPVVTAPAAPKALNFEVVASYPHNRSSFTQGLLWHDGYLYEGTGLEGQSTLNRVDLTSGKILQRTRLDDNLFGEGLALVGDRLFQLTWKTRRGFVYDRETFKPLGQFAYDTEGWGLTYDGKNLVRSDGSDTLSFHDTKTFKLAYKIKVTFDGQPLRDINELEYIDDAIWANIWQTDRIVVIDPKTGKVNSYLDLPGLLPASLRNGSEDVLNGIAYDAEHKRIFVTGKFWPRLYEIRLTK